MDDEIAGMGVSMKITVLEDLLDKAEHEFLPHIFQIIASSQEFCVVIDADARDVGFYQHLASGVGFKNLGHADAGDVGIFSGKIPEMLGLVAKVDFSLDGGLQLGQDLGQVHHGNPGGGYPSGQFDQEGQVFPSLSR